MIIRSEGKVGILKKLFWAIFGFDSDELQSNGTFFDNDGYNKQGFNIMGYDRDGYNIDGYNRYGYNRQGYNKQGFNILGKHKNDITCDDKAI